MGFSLTSVVVLLGVVVVGLFILNWRRLNREISIRDEEVPLSEIFDQEFSELNIGFSEFSVLWNDIARIFLVKPETIRPGDRFGIELPWRMAFGSNDEDFLLFSKYQERAAERGVKNRDELPEIRTVREYILNLSRI